MSQVRAKHPRFVAAVAADARAAAAARGDRTKFRGRTDAVLQAFRLAWECDGFRGLCFYRAQARFSALGIPIVPRLAHHLAAMTGRVVIGQTVVVEPGIVVAHGDVVIDGFVEIRRGAIIMSDVTIGLQRDPLAGHMRGPVIGENVRIETGARVLGPITLGRGARIGANAVVLENVPSHATAVGVPARVTSPRS
jgi:serine O-acetyltransferase